MDINLKSKINSDKYTKYVCEAYDIQNSEETITTIRFNIGFSELKDWNIGVVYGGSGSGKTSILKHIGEIKEPLFDKDKS